MTWEGILKEDRFGLKREEWAKRLRSLLGDLTSETEKAIEGKKIGITRRDLMEVEDMLNDAFEGISSLNKHSAAMSEVKRGE